MNETTTSASARTLATTFGGIGRALLISGLVALWPGVALADRAKALELYERGTISYNLREFRAAIGHYEAAYKEYPAPEFLFNIAQSYRQLDDCDQAVHFYKRYLALKPTAEERREVEGRIADLEARCKDRSVILEKPPEGTQAPARETPKSELERTARDGGERRDATKPEASGATKSATDPRRTTEPGRDVHGDPPGARTELGAAENQPRAPSDLSGGTGLDRPMRHVLFVLVEGGITQLAIGDSSTVQPSARLGVGFGVTEGALEIAIGPVVTWAQLPWVRGALEGRVTHVGALAEVALRYRVLRSLSLRAEAGGGASVLLGLSTGGSVPRRGHDAREPRAVRDARRGGRRRRPHRRRVSQPHAVRADVEPDQRRPRSRGDRRPKDRRGRGPRAPISSPAHGATPRRRRAALTVEAGTPDPSRRPSGPPLDAAPGRGDHLRVRVVMGTFGTAGDVLPFVELGRVLRARGHDVVIVTDRAHRSAVEAHGLTAHAPIARYDPVALTSDPRYAQPTLGPYRLWRDVFVPLVPEMFEAVRATLSTPTTVVLVHPWCHGALYAAEAARVPVASVAMAPVTWWSAEDPGVYSQHSLPRPLQRWLLRGPVRWLLDVVFGGALVEARRALALPPLPHPFFALGREALVSYGLWPRELRGPADDDPRGATICGFLRPTRPATSLDAGLEAFLAEGPAPIVVGVGSLLPPMAGELYAAARDVARTLGHRVVLVGADPSLAAGDVHVIAHAPYFALFPRARGGAPRRRRHARRRALRRTAVGRRALRQRPVRQRRARRARLGLARVVPRPSLTRRRLQRALTWALAPSTNDDVARRGASIRAGRCGAELVADDLERRFAR